ncbi:MAG TPA: MFS transporter, partial [bacterium]|nr:MFS transporter [bacterium]
MNRSASGHTSKRIVDLRERLQQRGIVIRIALVIGLAQLGFATVIPLLPLHLTERLGASVKLVGMVVAAFALVETVLKTAWGSVADRVGRRPMIIAGLVVSSLAPLAMSVLRQAWLFVPLRLVDGAGSSALWPAASAIIADTTPPHRRATAMGMLNMFFLAGLAFGPALALYIVGFTGSYVSGFYLASVV